MKIYVGGYKTTIGSDEESHPKIKLYKKRPERIVNKLHQKKNKRIRQDIIIKTQEDILLLHVWKSH